MSDCKPGTKSVDETDSDADTCCLGNNLVILECATKQMDAHACDKAIKPLPNVLVASGAAAWEGPLVNQTCVLVINKALCHGTKLGHSPIDPQPI